MKKTLPRLSLARETLRRLDPATLHAAGAQPPEYTSDITNCYICPAFPLTTEANGIQ